MAESYSVKAVLSALDSNFTSTFEKAKGVATGLSDKIKSGLGFGVLTGIGQQAFSSITSGIGGVVSELSSSSAAWKTFTGNMGMLGKSAGDIASVKDELQTFATQTIYSASDMASTYSQLEAVGIKSTNKLVKGFGGLAAAAENPQQAMKTLSMQATQMAAKPQVAWMDFKLMLEQTPAGIAAVAKQMGMTTSKLVSSVQDGTVATQDFFDAVAAVGTNDAFTKLATEYKTVDQAMDGLKETLSVKLSPAFDSLSSVGIDAIEGIIDNLDKIDVDSITTSVTGMVTTVEPYWNAFKDAVSTVGSACGDAFGEISTSVGDLLSKQSTIDGFTAVVKGVGDAIAFVAGIIADNADTIVGVTPYIIGLAVAFKMFKVVKGVASGVMSFTSSMSKLASQKLGKVAGEIVETATAQTIAGKSSAQNSKKTLASAKAFMMLGAGVALVSMGFALLAYSAISLAQAGPVAIGVMVGLVGAVAAFGAGMSIMLNSIKPGPAKLQAIAVSMIAMGAAVVLVAVGFALLTASAIKLASAGPLAIGVLVGMVAAIAGLAIGASILGPALTAGAVGFIAFGAAIALVGVGALLAAVALVMIVGTLPMLTEYGVSGAVSMVALGASMMIFGAGALVASIGAIALGAGLMVIGVGATIATVGVLALGVSALILGAGLLLAGVGASLLAPSLLAIGASTLTSSAGMMALSVGTFAFTAGAIAATVAALALAVSFVAFGVSLIPVSVGMVALAAGLLGVLASMKSIASNAKATEKSLTSMKTSINFVNSALEGLGSLAKSALKSLFNAFDNGESKAKSAGQNIGNGISNGVKSGMDKLPAIAMSATLATMVVLTSAQSSAFACGSFIGKGLGDGMGSQLSYVSATAEQLAIAAEKAIRAKAQIHSPSRVSDKLGVYWGTGLVDGIAKTESKVKAVSERLLSIPNKKSLPTISRMGMDSDLSDEYSYFQNAEYTLYAPLYLDGKEVANATATYTQEELEKMERFKNLLKGVR